MLGRVYNDRKLGSTFASFSIDELSDRIQQLSEVFKSEGFKMEIGQQLRNIWASYADNELSSTRDAYERSLREPEIRGNYVSVLLAPSDRKDAVAIMVEQGWDGEGFKEKLLDGFPAKVIRFEHAALGTKHGTPLGQGYAPHLGQAAATKIAESVKPQLKQIRSSVGRRFGRSSVTLGAGHAPVLSGQHRDGVSFQHKTDLYSGMQYRAIQGRKVGGQYKQGHSTLETFRTVTEDSDGWHHPGILARNYGERALDSLDKIMDAAVSRIVDEAFK